MGNAVLRGDLRARGLSRKVLLAQLFYLCVLGLLTFLGLPPELNQVDPSHEASLGLALLGIQVVLVAYCASACALQEIAVEGEKPAVDLAFGPFRPLAIVTGKSAASLLTVAYWVLLGAPLLVLAGGIRQVPAGVLAATLALVVVEAWGIAQVGLLYGVTVEGEFARTLVHWATLLVIFVATLALPASAQWANPVVAVTRAVAGAFPAAAAAAYAGLGVACGLASGVALRRFALS